MIEIVGTEGTSEYRAAIMIKNALEAAWPGVSTSPAEEDEIKIAVSAKIPGYKVQDIDIVLVGRFARPRAVRPTRVIRGQSGDRLNGKPLLVESFVVAVEVKDQDDRSVKVNDDQVQVRYSRLGKIEWKSATDQNVDQVHALKAYLSDQHVDVFVRRCLVFPSLSAITAPSAVAGGFNVHQLFSAIASPSPVLERSGQGILSAGRGDTVERVLAARLFRPVIPTRLDRERMERLSAKNPAIDDLLASLGSGTVFLRGYGGAGKTSLLLQTAWRRFRADGARTLILTYNLALAADMRRLMALAAIPSSAEDGGIEVGTLMSFLYKWFSALHLLEDDDLDYEKYPALCQAAIEMIKTGAVTRADIEAAVAAFPEKFDFDGVFVDEGQDWPQAETELIKALYGHDRLCVADGIDQLVRGQRADWRANIPKSQRKAQNLNTCLRLKRNLSLFASEVAHLAGLGWEAEPNPFAGGGRLVLLCKPYGASREVHDQLVHDLREDGNAPVDMLYCVSPESVSREGVAATSKISKTLASWGLDSWDGVDPALRMDFARSPEQARIVQYASCRGLEGWTVVLDEFDLFLEGRLAGRRREGLTTAEAESFVDLEVAATREAWRWAMIALTRPIDTLVIQLAHPEGVFSKKLIEIANSFEDFARVVR